MKVLNISLIIIFFYFNQILSFDLSNTEYNCIFNLLNKYKYDIPNNFQLQSDGQYRFCDYFTAECKDSKVVSLLIAYSGDSIISGQDFGCFSGLNNLYLYGAYLTNDFLYKVNHLETLTLEACYNMTNISYPILNVDSLIFNTSYQEYIGDLKISNLNNEFYMDPYPVSSNVSINLINDLTESKNYQSIQVITNNIPPLTNIVVYYLWLSLRKNTFKQDSLVNLKTFRDLFSLTIETDFNIDFPYSLFNVSESLLNELYLVSNINKPSSYINLQSYQNNIVVLEIVRAKDFHIDNDIPFSSLIGLDRFGVDGGSYSGLSSFYLFSTLNQLSITNSSINRKLPTFKRNNNLASLVLSGNGLTGSIDESYCTLGRLGKEPTIDLTRNSLTGFAPGCFLCYNKYFSNSFDSNQVQNAPACQISGTVYVDKVNRNLILQGSNLGFRNIIFGSYIWRPVVNSFRFQTTYGFSVPKNVSIVFPDSVLNKTTFVFQVSEDSPPPCYRNCTSKEFCDLKTSQCICNIGWTGEDCEIPDHYATSATSVDESGGTVIIYGLFGTVNKDLSVYIGNLSCTVIDVTNTTISCKIGPGTGRKNVYINQNNINWQGRNLFVYTKKNKSCVYDCGKNGVCDTLTAECKCAEGWSGLDCNSKDNPDTNTSIDNNGTTIINNDKTNYQIMITKLIEFDGRGEILKEHSLENKWVELSKTANSNISTFQQQLEQLPINCTIQYTIEEIKEPSGKNYEFAGFNFTLERGSIKISVSISSYQFYSSLSTLQLQFKSSVDTVEKNGCNYNDQIDLNNSGDDELNYITIKKDSSLLYGRFLNRILSDGRPASITSTKIITNETDSITLGLNLPMCIEECIIDPDFSVLVSTDFKSECNGPNGKTERPKYLIPVIVVCSIVGVAVLVSISYVIYRKKFVENQLSNRLKSMEMSNKSSK